MQRRENKVDVVWGLGYDEDHNTDFEPDSDDESDDGDEESDNVLEHWEGRWKPESSSSLGTQG
jgi:hypothetical protein